tara:strand:- start:308 stop:988 length:681 start_codon:yes stop_codon:yes gene_type:complete
MHRVAVDEKVSVKTGTFYAQGDNEFPGPLAALKHDMKRTYPSLLTDGSKDWYGYNWMIFCVLVHLASACVTMSAGILFNGGHTGSGRQKISESVDGSAYELTAAVWIMIIFPLSLVLITLIVSADLFGLCCKMDATKGPAMAYSYINQLLLGGFLIVFVATLKLNMYVLMSYSTKAFADHIDLMEFEGGARVRSLASAAIYLQAIVLGFTILNPVSAHCKYLVTDK